MASSIRILLIVALFALALDWADAVPARVRVTEERTITPRPVDTESEHADDDSEGVLGRLWSGLSTLTGFTKSGTAERLHRFRRDLLSNWHSNLKLLTKESKRMRRSIEDGFTTDAEGYWVLDSLDSNVNQHLKSFSVSSAANSLEMFEHESMLFWVVTSPSSIGVFLIDEQKNYHTTEIGSNEAMRCTPVLKSTHFVEIVCAENLEEEFRTGSSAYRITWENGLSISFVRSLPTLKAKDVVSWEINDKIYMAFANSYDSTHSTVECVSEVFELEVAVTDTTTFTNYDKLDTAAFITSNAYGVEAFKIMTRQFVAVANHKDDKGNVEVDSEIFIYDSHYSRMRPFQRIRTTGARDWAAFSFTRGYRSEYFLAVANEYGIRSDFTKNFDIESVIYRYDEVSEKFVPFQCITTHGALQWIAYKGPNGELLLSIVNKNGMVFYQYNGWRFVRVTVSADLSNAVVRWASMTYAPTSLNEVVLVISSDPQPEEYYVKFAYQNPLGEYHNKTAEWCQAYKDEMLGDRLADIVAGVYTAPKSNETFVFTKPVHLNGSLTVTANENASEVDTIINDSGPRVNYTFHNTTKFLIQTYTELNDMLVRVNSTAANAKTLDSPNLDNLHFAHLVTMCNTSNCIASTVLNLTVDQVNGISASYDNVALLNNTDVKLNLTFADVVVAGGATANIQQVNSSNTVVVVDEMLTLNKDHNISGQVTFHNIITPVLNASGLVDGMNVSAETLLLTHGAQTMEGTVTVQSVNTTMITAVNVNGEPFTAFIDSLVLNGTEQHITGNLTVSGIQAPSIKTTNSLSKLDPVTVKDRVLLHDTTETQKVTAYHTIAKINTQECFFNKLNEVSVPEDVFLKDENVTVAINTTFTSVTSAQINITNRLNDVQQKNGELQFLLLEGNATLSGKTFTNLTVEGDVTVNKLVSGYDLDYLAWGVHEEFLESLNDGRIVNGSVEFEKNLEVTSHMLGGANITKIRDEAVLLNASSITSTLNFTNTVQVVGDLNATRINGRNVEEYALLAGNISFTEPLLFAGNLIANEDIVAGSVNGYDLVTFNASVVKKNGDPQTIVQDLTISTATMNDLDVGGTVTLNGVDFASAVPLNATTTIQGMKNFTSLEVNSKVHAGAVDVGDFGKVDGVTIKTMFVDDAVRKSVANQEIAGRSFETVVAVNATGAQLNNFNERVVYRDENEHIRATLTLQGLVSIATMDFQGTFDGVPAASYKSSWLLKEGAQELTGQNTLQQATADAVTFHGSHIAGVDINNLYSNSAKINEVTTIAGITFDEVVSLGEVTLDNTIQGWHLKEEALQSSLNFQTVTGKKTFKGQVQYSNTATVDENLLVNTTGNNLTIPDTASFCTSFMDNSKTMGTLTVSGNADFLKHLNVTQTFNGESVETLDQVFWVQNLNYTISSVKSFDTVIVDDAAHVIMKGKINGEDFDLLADQALKNTCSKQTLTGDWNLNLTTSRLETDSITNTNQDSDVLGLANVLTTDGTQTIEGVKTFPQIKVKGNLELDGTLNSLNVTRDFVRYDRPATITAQKTFEGNFTVTGDLDMTHLTTIKGVDVSQLETDAVLHAPNGVTKSVSGTTTFKSLVVKDLIVGGTVDGVHVNESSILLTTGNQTVQGLLNVSKSGGGKVLYVQKELQIEDKMFNNIDLERLDLDSVRTNGAARTITADVKFSATPTFSNLNIENHLVNGYNLTDLAMALAGNHMLENMGNLLEEAIKASNDTYLVLQERPTDLWYFHETVLPYKLSMLQPVNLANSLGESPDTLIGIDRVKSELQVFGPEVDGRSLSDILKDMCVPEDPRDIVAAYPLTATYEGSYPLEVAGLGNGLLAVCGPAETHPTGVLSSLHQNISDEHNIGVDYGYIIDTTTHQKVVTFRTVLCKDLVSLKLDGGRVCLAVLDHNTTSTVMCGRPETGFQLLGHLGTSDVVKGAALNLGEFVFLLTLEDDSFSLSSHLKVFQYSDSGMILKYNHEMQKSHDLNALSDGTEAVVAVTVTAHPFSYGSIDLFTVKLDLQNSPKLEKMQSIEVDGALTATLSKMHKYEMGLFVQREKTIKLYVRKGMQFVYDREILTSATYEPVSFPYFHTGRNTTFLAFAAGQEMEDDGSVMWTASTYEARYRP